MDGLSAFTGADMKFVFSLVGTDMTGETGTFHVSTAPEEAPLLSAAVTLVDVVYDSDDVPVSLMEAYLPRSMVSSAKASLAPIDPGSDITLYFEFRVSAIAGEAGTPAETTLLYGNFPLKGSI